jgi:hypothetical protein
LQLCQRLTHTRTSSHLSGSSTYVNLASCTVHADSQKPSSLWPPPPPQLTEVMQSRMRTKVKEVVHHLKNPHHHDDGQARSRSLSFLHRDHPDDADDLEKAFRKRKEKGSIDPTLKLETAHPDPKNASKGGTLHPSGNRGDTSHHPSPQIEADGPQSLANPGLLFAQLEKRDTRRDDGKGPTTLAQCDTPLELAVWLSTPRSSYMRRTLSCAIPGSRLSRGIWEVCHRCSSVREITRFSGTRSRTCKLVIYRDGPVQADPW